VPKGERTVTRSKRERRARRQEIGRARNDGSQVSWQWYRPGDFGGLANNEMLIMDDGCSVQRRGDRLRWVEPAALLQEHAERSQRRAAALLAELDELAAA
jgi:hypothetical protein